MRNQILEIIDRLENVEIKGSRNASLILGAISDLHLIANVLAEVEAKPKEQQEENVHG